MRSKFVLSMLAVLIMIGESSCSIKVGGRKHGVAAGVGYVPVENQQQKSVTVPINPLLNPGSTVTASK